MSQSNNQRHKVYNYFIYHRDWCRDATYQAQWKQEAISALQIKS